MAPDKLFSTASIPYVILEKWSDPWGTLLKATPFSFLVKQSRDKPSLAQGSVERVW